MSVDATVLERIRKCRELADCATGGEAAAALAAAQRLMERYSVTESDVLTAGIVESNGVRAGAAAKPVDWETALVSTVGKAFACRPLFSYYTSHCRRGTWKFVGPRQRAEVADYVFTVLLRKVRAARRAHLAGLGRLHRHTKTLRADAFCYAWVKAVAEKVERFSSSDERSVTAIDAYMGTIELGENVSPTSRPLRKSDAESFHAGYREGSAVELQHGVSADQARQLEFSAV